MFRVCLLSLMIYSTLTSAEILKCGSSQAAVINSSLASYPYFTIAVVGNAVEKLYKFPIQNERLSVRCEQLSDGKPVLVVLHTCGGSGCADLANFGIIDATTGAVLLEPNERMRGNADKARKIMGKDLEPFSCSIKGRETQNATKNGELCFRSGIELGYSDELFNDFGQIDNAPNSLSYGAHSILRATLYFTEAAPQTD